jgi:hypothetical protein
MSARVQEAQDKRDELEVAIRNLIHTFERETGLRVVSIHLRGSGPSLMPEVRAYLP